ncbi:DNA polymerase IV [Sphingomonas sp. S1-29]|uniref:DNA polymerase IV n=1 Tax=Sphingomonas sp. S1-29 TaxID=2991074 RepID=UPI00223F0DE1|nr:DNA polymerase IV [Sphingomonas sp. S1-29]UZK68510.1 DNA polymerase IV [Sphingomonas sp. S1-29]
MTAAAPGVRKIIHIDMDAFYASVEQRDFPELRGKPVAVGGSRARGVVAAASYEARKFGVRSAMPSVTAAKRCPDLVFVSPRFDVYSAVSRQIRAIFAEFTPLIEPLSLDEAYLDVSADLAGIGSARDTAAAIRARIAAETGLTASAGVSYNKFIAKLASDQNKPDGLCVIPPGHGAAFVGSLPVRRFHGVGPVTAAKMERMGILTGADLAGLTIDEMRRAFGSFAEYLYAAARGEDHRPVRVNRESKSIGAERTFEHDLSDWESLIAGLERVADAAWVRIERHQARGRRVTLKLRYNDFRTITRARTLAAGVGDRAAFGAAGDLLLRALYPVEMPVRLLGLTLSALGEERGEDVQPGLPLG